MANLTFARVVEPESQALLARQEEAVRLRAAGSATVPAPLALERATNPFLRFDDPGVVEAAERYAGHPLTDPVEVFATVRAWKDALD